MKVDLLSASEVVTVGQGVVQMGFDLSTSDAGYLLIDMPDPEATKIEDFFGHNHYVEVRDQLGTSINSAEHRAG
ncbi:hypothetical protein CHU93_06295, partial [Sandarakinorhabdus cyanobacteriorum]